MEDNMFSEMDAHIEGQLVEFKKGDHYAGRAVLGTPVMTAINAPKGEKLKSGAKSLGHVYKETGKGAAGGAGIGATIGAGVLGALALRKRGLRKSMRTLRKNPVLNKGRFSGSTARAVLGSAAVAGGAIGAYGGTGVGNMKGHYCKKATSKYREDTGADKKKNLSEVMDDQLREFRGRYEQEDIDKKKVAAGAVGVAGLAGAGTLANSAIKAKRGGESMKSWADMKKAQADNLTYNARRKVGMGYDWKRNMKNAPGKVARAMRMTR
jgi:hypothetical protein